MNKLYLLTLLLVAAVSPLFAQITITDGDLTGGNTYTWTNDNEYLLDGFVYLEDGGVLNIEPGTVIRGKEVPTGSDNASALIISRGAQIFANGTALEPIVFTAEDDDLNDPDDFDPDDRGFWGGLIILGYAGITDEECVQGIEGIPAGEPRALYGDENCNFDDEDNSGILRYISIRHAGAALSPGNEINGLTLGAVGSTTVVENVEVFANFDDGIEWFGGTVSVKFAAVSFCGDDSYDYDTGWRGKGQFWLSLQGEDLGDNGGEHDGAKPDDNTPTSNPVIYNATYIGSGVDNDDPNVKNEHALYMRDGTAGTYANSIFTDFTNFAIQIEDRASGLDSRQRMEDGELVIKNNIWFGFGEGDELNAGTNGIIQATDDAEDATCQFLIDHLGNNGNSLEDPEIANINREPNNDFDPRPSVDGPAYEDLAGLPSGDDFYTQVNFKGAFGATLWVRGWTALDNMGFLPEQGEVVITDADLVGGESYTWTNDNEYLLDGFVYLEEGGKLTIGPGTVIKGKEIPSSSDNASALIITRGAQICAVGEMNNPIIFTAEADDTNDPDDLDEEDRGFWGGLIILGRAGITDEECEQAIEGIPAGEPRARYGDANCNFNDNDNSGELRYVSIRHGGAALSPGNEINGLTLGAVGSATKLNFIEVFANFDDGIEWFGGTASVKFASVAFCGDDSYDYDTGWRGKGQFWFSLQGADIGDNGGEHDGAKPDDNTPTSDPVIYNATYIGSGADNDDPNVKNEHALYMRDGTAGTYANSIFTDFTNFAIQIEDRASGLDSRQRMEDGELVIKNNIWFGFGEGDELNAGTNGIIQATDDAEDPMAQFLIDHLGNNGNTLEDPMLGGISRTNDGGLDPRPDASGPAFNNIGDIPSDGFYSQTLFRGAFCDDGVWIKGWTAIDEYGILDSDVPAAEATCLVGIDELLVEKDGFVLAQAYPNPAAGETTIDFVLPETLNVTMRVFDRDGRVVRVLMDNERQPAGENQIILNAADLTNGVYYYTLESGSVVLTKSFIVAK